MIDRNELRIDRHVDDCSANLVRLICLVVAYEHLPKEDQAEVKLAVEEACVFLELYRDHAHVFLGHRSDAFDALNGGDGLLDLLSLHSCLQLLKLPLLRCQKLLGGALLLPLLLVVRHTCLL